MGDCDDSTGIYHNQHPYSASGASLLRASTSAVRSAKMMSSLAHHPSNHQPSQSKLMISSFQLPSKANRCNTSADFSTDGAIVNVASPVANGNASVTQSGFNRLGHKNWRQHRSMQVDDQIQMIRKNASSAFASASVATRQ